MIHCAYLYPRWVRLTYIDQSSANLATWSTVTSCMLQLAAISSSLNLLGEFSTLVCLVVIISKLLSNFPACTLQLTKAIYLAYSLDLSKEGRKFGWKEMTHATFLPSVTFPLKYLTTGLFLLDNVRIGDISITAQWTVTFISSSISDTSNAHFLPAIFPTPTWNFGNWSFTNTMSTKTWGLGGKLNVRIVKHLCAYSAWWCSVVRTTLNALSGWDFLLYNNLHVTFCYQN